MTEISPYDKWLSTEPDNGFNKWQDEVWSLIPDAAISEDEYEANEKFFEDGIQALSTAGSLHGSFTTASFAAHALIFRFRILKNNPHLKTWEEVQDWTSKNI